MLLYPSLEAAAARLRSLFPPLDGSDGTRQSRTAACSSSPHFLP